MAAAILSTPLSVTPLAPELVAPPALHLTEAEKKIAQFYINPKPSGCDKAKMGADCFIDTPPVEKVKLVFVSFAAIAAGALLGASIGGAVGGGIGSCIEPGGGTAIGFKAGAAVGGTVGGLVAGFYSTREIIIFVTESTHFLKWKIDAVNRKVYPLFQELLKEEEFQDFICPISAEITRVPVEAPCHHIFEKSHIEKWLKERPQGSTSCPYKCNVDFSAEQLTYSLERVAQIVRTAIAKSDQLKKQEADVKYQGQSKEFVDGLKALAADGKAASVHAFKQVVCSEIDIGAEAGLSGDDMVDVFKKTLKKLQPF
jgi:hypothetical protein